MSEHVEVVVAGLPELGARAFEYFGDLALENTESGGERMELWFAEEKVDVFGHEDVAEEEEPVSPSESFESLFKTGAGAVVVEIWEAVVTAKGDEVVVAFGLMALQTARH
jgi:hypothetical protein